MCTATKLMDNDEASNIEASPLLFVNSSRTEPCAREAHGLLWSKLTIDCELNNPVKAHMEHDDKASSWLVLTNETHLFQKLIDFYEASPILIVTSSHTEPCARRPSSRTAKKQAHHFMRTHFNWAMCTATELIVYGIYTMNIRLWFFEIIELILDRAMCTQRSWTFLSCRLMVNSYC